MRALRGSGVTVTAQVIRLALNLLSTIVLARVLAPADFGLVGMVTAITGLAVVFKDLGLAQATIQRSELTEADVSTLFWINVSFSILTAAAFIASAPLLTWFYGEPRLTWITIAMGCTIIPGGLAVQHQAILQRQMRFLPLAIIDLSATLLGLGAALIAASRGAGYWALVLMQGATAVAFTIGVWTQCRWLPSAPKRNPGVRELLDFGRYLTGFNLVNHFARNLDDILIGRFWGAAQVGLYNRAYQLLVMPIHLGAAPVGTVAISTLSRLAEEPERYRRAYLKAVEVMSVVTMPAVALLIMTSDWLFIFLLGEKWSEASRIFSWLGISAFTQPIGHSVGWLFVSQGRTREMWQWGLISTAIIVASIGSGLYWGAVGVAAAYSLVGLVVRTPMLFWFVGRHGPVRTIDLYRTPLLGVSTGLATIFVLKCFRSLAPDMSPLSGLLLSGLISVSTALLVLSLLPKGRNLLRSLRTMAFAAIGGSLPGRVEAESEASK